MKCFCGYQQKPDNLETLRKHVAYCQSAGALKNVQDVSIVWEHGEFVVVAEKREERDTFATKPPVPINPVNHSTGFDGIIPPVKPVETPTEPEPEPAPKKKPATRKPTGKKTSTRKPTSK